MSEDVPDYWPRPASRRYVFSCLACRKLYEIEGTELEHVRPDFLRLDHTCTACGARALVTVTGANCELKVEEIATPAVRPYKHV